MQARRTATPVQGRLRLAAPINRTSVDLLCRQTGRAEKCQKTSDTSNRSHDHTPTRPSKRWPGIMMEPSAPARGAHRGCRNPARSRLGQSEEMHEHSGPDSMLLHSAAGRNRVDRGHAPTAARNHLRAKQWERKGRIQFLRSRHSAGILASAYSRPLRRRVSVSRSATTFDFCI
jgi:hypothetical protein